MLPFVVGTTTSLFTGAAGRPVSTSSDARELSSGGGGLARTATSSRTLGLKNAFGEQNCFLNVVIQALWRQKSCRDFFFSIGDPWVRSNPILTSLTVLMTEYKYSDENILPPDQVRRALADVYASLNRFQLGEMDDAAESFQAILVAMHGTVDEETSLNTTDIDKPCADRETCLGHQVFALDFLKEDRCLRCNMRKEAGFGTMFSYHLYAQEAVELAQLMRAGDGGSDGNRLAVIMRELDFQKRGTCGECKTPNSTVTVTTLLSFPKVLCINIVWPQADCDRMLLNEVMGLLKTSLVNFRLNEAFLVPAEGAFLDFAYDLTGMICFYPGGHYVFFGLVGSSREWFIFDDHETKHVGSFEQVMDRCDRAKYQPVCLFYEKSSKSNHPPPPRRPAPPPPPLAAPRTTAAGGPPPTYAEARRQTSTSPSETSGGREHTRDDPDLVRVRISGEEGETSPRSVSSEGGPLTQVGRFVRIPLESLGATLVDTFTAIGHPRGTTTMSSSAAAATSPSSSPSGAPTTNTTSTSYARTSRRG